jgi:pimeloyl-ACP methyl ester carboxylesterase
MSTTRSRDGTEIAYDRLGEGAPVVLVHPAFGHRAFDPLMGELAQRLSGRFTVYTYDRRGRGESADAPHYAVERELEDLDALITEAGGSAFVYGMSSGAALALEAANRGLAVRALALYEPPFIVDDTAPPMPADYQARLAELLQAGRRGDAVAYAMTNFGAPAEMVEQVRAQPVWPAFEAVAHTLPYDAAVMGDTRRGGPLPPERTASVRVPTLVIVGSAAGDWARNAAHALADALPEGRVCTLEGEFHAAAPAALAEAVGDFFAAA